MRYALIYKKEDDNYKYLDILNGVYGIINRNRIIEDYDSYVSESQGIIFINNDLPTEESKYFLIRHLGSGKLLYIDMNGKLKVGCLSTEELRYVSNELSDLYCGSSKKKFTCYEKEIILCNYGNNLYIMMALIYLYNRDNAIKSNNNIPSYEKADCWSIDTLKVQESNNRYKGVHIIGNNLYVLAYNYTIDYATKNEVLKKLPKTFASIYTYNKEIIPLLRVSSDNLYYYVLDTTLMKSRTLTKQSIRKVSFQEIVKVSNMTEQRTAYFTTKTEDGYITISSLDGVYKYNIDEVNKFYNIEIITDMLTLSRKLLGKESDNIIMNNRYELLRAEPINDVFNIPVECKILTKSSIYARQLNSINIHKNVTSIQTDFIKDYPIWGKLYINIDNSPELELLGVFRTARKATNLNLRVTVKNKLVNYQDIKYVISNTLEYFTFEGLLEEVDVKQFLHQYSIKEFKSFKWLDKNKLDTVMLDKWGDLYTLMGVLKTLSDENGKQFIEKYINHIDNKIVMWYNKYKSRE